MLCRHRSRRAHSKRLPRTSRLSDARNDKPKREEVSWVPRLFAVLFFFFSSCFFFLAAFFSALRARRSAGSLLLQTFPVCLFHPGVQLCLFPLSLAFQQLVFFVCRCCPRTARSTTCSVPVRNMTLSKQQTLNVLFPTTELDLLTKQNLWQPEPLSRDHALSRMSYNTFQKGSRNDATRRTITQLQTRQECQVEPSRNDTTTTSWMILCRHHASTTF